MPGYASSGEHFPNIQPKPHLAQLEPVSSCLFACYLQKKTSHDSEKSLRFPGQGLAEAGSAPGASPVRSSCGRERAAGRRLATGVFVSAGLCAVENGLGQCASRSGRRRSVTRRGRAGGSVSCCRYGAGGAGVRGAGGGAGGGRGGREGAATSLREQEQEAGCRLPAARCLSYRQQVRPVLSAVAAAMALLSLTQLLDAAIGTNVESVNFRALRDLLQAVLGHLGLQEGSTRALEQPAERDRARTPAAGQQPQQADEQLPAKDALRDATSRSEADVAADVGQLVERVEGDESSSSEDTAVYQAVLEEISQMKEAQSRMQGEIRMIQEALGLGNHQDAASQTPGLCNLRTLASDVQMLKERLGLYPDPEEVNNMVHWDVLEDCLVGSKAERCRDGGRPRGEQEGEPSPTTKPPTTKPPPTKPPPTKSPPTKSPPTKSPPTKPPTTKPPPTKSPPTKSPPTKSPPTKPPPTKPPTTKPPTTKSPTTKSPTSDVDTPHGASSVLGSRESSVGLKDPGTALTAPKQQAGIPSDQRRDASTTAVMQTVSQDVQTTSLGTQPAQPEPTRTQTTTLGTQPESTVTQTTISGEQLSTQLDGAGPLAAGTLLPTAQGFEIPLNADPRSTSHVQEPALPSASSSAYQNAYKCYVETVEALKQIGQLRHLYAALKEQVAQLEATGLERTELEKLRLLLQERGQESVANTLGDLQAQVSSLQGLASDLQGLSRELQGVARDLQGEKGKIRKLESALAKLEAARASWQMDPSDQLSLPLGSTPQEVKRDMKDLAQQRQISKAALDQLVTQTAKEEQEREQLEEARVTESTGQEEAVCPMCSSDTSTRLEQLLRRYEKLQGLVDSLMSRKKMGKALRQLPGKSQDQEVLKRIQAAILQMQGEYEKLNSVMGSLLDDSRQQQEDIEGLLQSVERLEKEKADKEDLKLGMDEKADKGALESKVSRAQFEASLELLKEQNQEVLSRLTGQEQGLHEVQQQLREEMASKLDRLELEPFQQELDDRWKSSLEQLKKMAPPMEADSAAGFRKQLLVDFQCLSCDRQLSMRVPGSPIPPIPRLPPLVPRVTGKSQPVPKTEQTRREPMAACTYPTVPRQCGGQCTVTRPLQRSLRLPLDQPRTPQAVQPSTLLSSKDKIKPLWQDSRRAGPCPSAPGTTGPLKQRSGSSHSHLLQVHWPHPPLQPRRMDAASRQQGRTGAQRLNPIAPAPQQARK
ncbi:uncharacterized protein LOC136005971 [Lathamus discolor]|uniref:uncharacterized protein LOC136005971 n=1 Tax=Lathamus discolor TaxID=678569 RepID=UPI0032B81F60